MVIDSVIRTLNPPSSEIDAERTEVANRRLEELQTGKVKAMLRDDVFAKIRERSWR
jgi:hypothetical protein